MATTKTSIRLINTEKNKDAGANQILLNININDIKLISKSGGKSGNYQRK